MADTKTPLFSVSLAKNDNDVRAAQQLRYNVFVEELGGGGLMVDHENRIELIALTPIWIT